MHGREEKIRIILFKDVGNPNNGNHAKESPEKFHNFAKTIAPYENCKYSVQLTDQNPTRKRILQILLKYKTI